MTDLATLQLTKSELITIHAMCVNHSEYIIRDVYRIKEEKGSEQVIKFYLDMLKDHHSLLAKVLEKL